MSDLSGQVVPGWFKAVAIIAMVWNLLGIIFFGLFLMMINSPEMMEAVPAEQREMMANVPTWAVAANGIAVLGGFLGCLFLVMKKNIAGTFLVASLAGILVQDYHSFVVANGLETYGAQGLIMPAIVVLVAVYLVILARKGKANGWTS